MATPTTPSLTPTFLFSSDAFLGKTALITGVRGIGLAVANVLAVSGARLALADIDRESAHSAVAQLPRQVAAIAVDADISVFDHVKRMIEQAEKALGPIDIFVNCAAVADDKRFLESTREDWDRLFGVCLYGPMLCLHNLLPGMTERGYGRIVCLASDSARVGQARLSYYAAAKGGVVALVKSVAQEVGGHGVTLNVVSPGATETPMRQEREQKLQVKLGVERYAQRVQAIARMYPVGRIGRPEDVASAIAFLASEQAGWITGQVISVNGGFVMP